jgi:hypothetical protein
VAFYSHAVRIAKKPIKGSFFYITFQIVILFYFLFGLGGYWHYGHSWPIVPARLAGETEVLGENLPQRHFCPSQNPT